MTDDELLRGNPIQKPEEDLLDRAKIIDRLSELIINDNVKDCCTLGIIGKWGSGKSSVINLIEVRVCEKTNNKIHFIKFSPIDYSTDANSISQTFFEVIISNLNEIDNAGITRFKKYLRIVPRVIKRLLYILFYSSKPIPDIPGIIDNIEKLAEAIVNPSKYEPVENIKKTTSELLLKSNNKLIIIIDDIDRLTSDEATQILKLIRVTANFQNVFYILAYDEEVLSKLLDEKLGHDFLEKFIQVPVRLPEIDRSIIQEMLYKKLIISITEFGFESNEYTKIACRSVQISTIRELCVLINKYNVKIKMCFRDVCPEDMLVLTYIEMKDSKLFDWVYENRLLLCNTGKTFVKEEGSRGFKSPLDSIIDKPEMKSEAEAALEFLYPHLFKSYIKSGIDELRKYQIYYTESCDVYFSLKVPPASTSNVVIDDILKSDNRINEFCTILINKIRGNIKECNSFLMKIVERLNEFDGLDKINMARALLFDKKLIDPKLAKKFPLDYSLQLPARELLLDTIFKQLTESDIKTIFNNNLPEGEPYALTLDYVYLHGLSVESKRGREMPMAQSCLDSIKDITGCKLCEAAPNYEPSENARESRAFFVFLSVINQDIAKREFNRSFNTNESIIKFIEENFDDIQIRAFEQDIIEELVKYLPDERIPLLIDCSDKYRDIFETIQKINKLTRQY